jgi:hypothetical protein
MAGNVPDLIIPLRLDPSKATAALGKVGAAGTKAGNQVAGGAGKGKKGLQDLETGAGKASESLLALGRAQLGLSTLRTVTGAIGEEFKRAADYIKDISAEFADLRKTMQEVATLKGSANNNEFTVQEAKTAQQFHLNPQEYRDFQAQFMNYAGSQIGTDEKTGQLAEGAKLSNEQGQEYAGRVAELMKGSGVNPAVGAELAGSLLENAKGPQNVEDLMKKLGRTFNVLEKGRVPLGQALPQISQIMGHGIESEEAAKLFSIASPAAAGQEGNAVESALKAIEEMKAEGKGDEFGVKRGMGQYESVKAFAENINKRKADLVASGKTEQEATDEVAAQLKEKGVAADIRERRGLIAGFARQGVELGGFKRYEKIEAETPEDFEAARKKRYEESDQGKRDAVEIEKAVSRTEKGAERDEVDQAREKARAALIKEGAFEQPNVIGNMARGALGKISGVDAQEQLVNERALFEAQRQHAATPHDTDRYFGEGNEAADAARAKTFAASASQGEVDAELKAIMKEIAENTKRTAEKKTEAAETGPAKPLSSKPPGGAGARQ